MEAKWRRGRDSNPRCPCEHAAFRVRCIRPLCHLSAVMVGRCRRGALDNDWTSRLQGQICRMSGFFDAVSIWSRPGGSDGPADGQSGASMSGSIRTAAAGLGTADHRTFVASAGSVSV